MILATLSLFGAAMAAQVFIVPSKAQCKLSNCYTLQEFAVFQDNNTLDSTTTITFMVGSHILRYPLTIHDVEYLILMDYGRKFLNSEAFSTIVCGPIKSRISFVNVTNLYIEGLTINDCGARIGEKLSHIAYFNFPKTQFTFSPRLKVSLFFINIRYLLIKNITIHRSDGYALLALNALSYTVLQFSNFDQSNYLADHRFCWSSALAGGGNVNCRGGNAFFLYVDPSECSLPRNYSLNISNTKFSRGLDLFETYGSGLTIILSQASYGVHVRIQNVELALNRARRGANLDLRVQNTVVNSSFFIERCNSFGANAGYYPRGDINIRNSIGDAGGLHFLHGFIGRKGHSGLQCEVDVMQEDQLVLYETVLLIQNSIFRLNYAKGGSGGHIQFYTGLTRRRNLKVVIRNTRFFNNTGNYGVALWLIDSTSSSLSSAPEFSIHNVSFQRNRPFYWQALNPFPTPFNSFLSSWIVKLLSTVFVKSVRKISFQDCTFSMNNYTSLFAVDSKVYFEGQLVFNQNIGFFGAGIYLSSSIIFLTPNTTIFFENNQAVYRGGAIYITSVQESVFAFDCSFQIFDSSFLPISELDIHLLFRNNSAREAGDAMYGGDLDNCVSAAPSSLLYTNNSFTSSDFIYDFSGQNISDSLISSDSQRICLCHNGVHNCSVRLLTVEYFPGEEFGVSVVGVGQKDGTVPVVTRALFLYSPSKEFVRRAGRTCTENRFRVASSLTMEPLLISVPEESHQPTTNSLQIYVFLKHPCPIGFGFNNVTEICDCDIRLRERNMTCNIDTRVIKRTPPHWLSNYSDFLLLHDHCPFDYCKTSSVPIIMKESNISKQCAFNRYGRLCGQCKRGLSAVFGTSRCRLCSNIYLLLIFPIAVVGLLLVVFLFLLNLTVAEGTINGLIFYANVFKINEAIFLPPGDHGFLKVFISWVNLDLGIETCFFDGMDSYAKTWLQFVFPFYLWLLLLAIIIASRYSSFVVRLFGYHSVDVLATIFLLSYTKLLRVIITTLSFTTLDYPSEKRSIWLYDGTLDFGKGTHSVLVVFSIIVLAVIAIPYTLLILFVQLLRRYSNKKLLRWVDTLMPIFDAYLGPYKPKQGYWTGFLLLTRVLLAAAFAFNISGNPAVNVMVITLTTAALIIINLGFGGVYKKTYLTVLELFFVINLGVLSVVTAYILEAGGNQTAAGYVSISVALASFVIVCVFHAVKRGKDKLAKIRRRRKDLTERRRVFVEESSLEANEINYLEVSTTYVDIAELSDSETL